MRSESESLICEGRQSPRTAEGNCVAAMRGGEQPEAEEQSRSVKLNSIRRPALASLLTKGEACRESGDEDLWALSYERESESAGRGWSGNVPKVSCDKWRDPQSELTQCGSQSVHSSEEGGESRRSEGTQEGECAESARAEGKAPRVPPSGARQGAEVPRKTRGIEPRVWTERMQAALERGVEGKRWFSLIDKVWSLKTLQWAWERVKANAGASGVDNMSVERFAKDWQARLLAVNERLKGTRHEPKPIKRVRIPKEGTKETRPLGIPTVEDRIVQTALRMVVEPTFERDSGGVIAHCRVPSALDFRASRLRISGRY